MPVEWLRPGNSFYKLQLMDRNGTPLENLGTVRTEEGKWIAWDARTGEEKEFDKRPDAMSWLKGKNKDAHPIYDSYLAKPRRLKPGEAKKMYRNPNYYEAMGVSGEEFTNFGSFDCAHDAVVYAQGVEDSDAYEGVAVLEEVGEGGEQKWWVIADENELMERGEFEDSCDEDVEIEENPSDASIAKLKAIVAADEYERYGLRNQTRYYGKGRKLRVGQIAPKSYRWDDGHPTREQLSGTSAIEIRGAGDVDRAVKMSEGYGSDGWQVALLGSNSWEGGEDRGEIVMHDAKVLAVWRRRGEPSHANPFPVEVEENPSGDPRVSSVRQAEGANGKPYRKNPELPIIRVHADERKSPVHSDATDEKNAYTLEDARDYGAYVGGPYSTKDRALKAAANYLHSRAYPHGLLLRYGRGASSPQYQHYEAHIIGADWVKQNPFPFKKCIKRARAKGIGDPNAYCATVDRRMHQNPGVHHAYSLAAYQTKDGKYEGVIRNEETKQRDFSPRFNTLAEATHWCKTQSYKVTGGKGSLAPMKRKGEYRANVWMSARENPSIKERASEAWKDTKHFLTKSSTSKQALKRLKEAETKIAPAQKFGLGKKRNPEDSASALYEEFHGRPPSEIVEVHTEVHEHENLTSLGYLCSLVVKTTGGKQIITVAEVKSPRDIPNPLELPMDKRVLLCSNEEATSLYFLGGDQEVSLDALGLDKEEYVKDLMVLGELQQVTYMTQKHFDNYEDVAYYHALGEESGERPLLLYDPISCLLSVAGGAYSIRAEGITN
jgi:hypothetical protein